MSRQVTIAVIGKGRLGTSLAYAIRSLEPSYRLIAHLPARSKSFIKLSENEGPDVVFIVCKDKFIHSVSEKAVAAFGKNTKFVVHCAGSLSSSILSKHRGIQRLMLHPIQTFAHPDPQAFEGISFAAESADRSALQFARRFAKRLGGEHLIVLKPPQLALYHAAIVIVSNFITLLGMSVEELADELSITRSEFKKAIAPLMKKSLYNILYHDAKTVLTGPIARGDRETIRRHIRALNNTSSKDMYKAVVKFAEKII